MNIIEVEGEEEDEESYQDPSPTLQSNTKANASQNPMLLINPFGTPIISNPSVVKIATIPAEKLLKAPKTAKPLIMSLNDLYQVYGVMSILALVIRLSYESNPPHGAIVFCNFSTTYFIRIMLIACIVTVVLTSVMSEILGTPDEIRDSLLTKCITTPVAISFTNDQ